MELFEKLDALMKIAGISNSKLARELRIDPSLVSRWRNGTRRPMHSSRMMTSIALEFSQRVTEPQQLGELAQAIGKRIPNSREGIEKVIYAWLNEKEKGSKGGVPSNALMDSEGVTSNVFAGPKGRKLVLERLLAQSQQDEDDDTVVRLYSSDPEEWLRADISHRRKFLQKNPEIFDNVRLVKLMMNSSATTGEILSLIKYALPFLKSGVIQVAQTPHYRKFPFTHTLLISGKGAAATSYSFAGSSNFMTNLYTEPAFVAKLTHDFDSLFDQCEQIHTLEEGVNAIDLAEEFEEFLYGKSLSTYLGNAIPLSLVPFSLAKQLHGKVYEGQGNEGDGHYLFTREFADHFDASLNNHAMRYYLPLYQPHEVEDGAVAIVGLPRFIDQQPLITKNDYRTILVSFYNLYRKNTKLLFSPLSPLDHEYSILFQDNTSLRAVRNKAPYVSYKSFFSNILHAISLFVNEKYGDECLLMANRESNLRMLETHIALFDE